MKKSAVVFILIATLALVACGRIDTPSHHISASRILAKESCLSAFRNWESHGGLVRLHTATVSAQVLGRQIESHSTSGVQRANVAVQSATRAAMNDLPPPCVPRLDKDEITGLLDIQNASQFFAEKKFTQAKANLFSAETALGQAAQDVVSYSNS